MAACALMVRQAVLVLVVALISHTSSNRLSGHPFFKSRTVDLPSSTTPKPTDKVVIDDKLPGPSVKFPSSGQSFLDYLMNRDTYFDKTGSLRSSTESTIISSSPTTQLTSTRTSDPTTSTLESTTETLTTSTTPKSTSETSSTSTTSKSTSETLATSTTSKSTSETLASSTTSKSTSETLATSTTPESRSETLATSTTPKSTSETSSLRASSTESTWTTARTSTASWNSQVRPEQLPFDPQAQTKDRLNRFQLADLWLQRFRRPSVLEPVQGRFRSGDADPGNTTNGNGETASRSPSPSNGNQNHGMVEVDPYGGVYVVYNKQTELKTTTLAMSDKLGPTPEASTTQLDVQDKPYYGSNLGTYFENNVSTSSHNQTDQDGHKGRSRRAAGVAVANATSCADPHQFQPCQYYPQCFHDLTEMCSTRDSFLGDLFSRFCSKTLETSKSTGSDLLSRYLRDVELCFREGLVKIVESPSCTEMSSIVLEALLLKRSSSCLYQRETFCNVLNDDVARPSLARMFNSTNDVQFMFRVMVNIGNMAAYCRNHGASIFLTDITLLATSKDSPFKDLVGKTPMPSVVQKI